METAFKNKDLGRKNSDTQARSNYIKKATKNKKGELIPERNKK